MLPHTEQSCATHLQERAEGEKLIRKRKNALVSQVFCTFSTYESTMLWKYSNQRRLNIALRTIFMLIMQDGTDSLPKPHEDNFPSPDKVKTLLLSLTLPEKQKTKQGHHLNMLPAASGRRRQVFILKGTFPLAIWVLYSKVTVTRTLPSGINNKHVM